MKTVYSIALGLLFNATSTFAGSTTTKANDLIAYPNGYQDWFHVKTMLIKPGHPLENPFQGIHHIYANEKAKKGLETGHYEKGAVFVFDLLNYTEKDQTIQESNRKLIGVMEMDQNQYSSTGGWGFEGFAENSRDKRLVSDGGQSCYACHLSQNKTGYVFTKLR